MEKKAVWIQLLNTVILVCTLVYLGMQTKNLSQQTKSLEKSIVGNTYTQIVSNHRELHSNIFNYPFLGRILHPGSSDEEVKKRYFVSMMINHAENIYTQYKLGNMSEDMWQPIANDMVDMFTKKEVKARWNQVKFYHRKDFRHFIEKQIPRVPK